MESLNLALANSVVFSEVYKVVKNSTSEIWSAPSYSQSGYYALIMVLNIGAILLIPELIKAPLNSIRALYYYFYCIILWPKYRRLTLLSNPDATWESGTKGLDSQLLASMANYFTDVTLNNKILKVKCCYFYNEVAGVGSGKGSSFQMLRYTLWIPRFIKDRETFEKLMLSKTNSVYHQLTKSPEFSKANPFVSSSYVKIGTIVRRLLNIRLSNSNIVVPALIINGPPGLGKMFLYKYLGTLEYSYSVSIYYVNCLSYNVFEDLMSHLEQKSSPRSLFMIDEIDKWLDLLCTKIDKDGRLLYTRCALLSQIMNLVDHNSATKIFCTNNFDTLFRDQEVHFTALKSRFLSVDMEPYNSDDVKGFYHYINESLKDTDCYMKKESLEAILAKIKPDITTALPRQLNQILIAQAFNFEEAVVDVNKTY